MYIIPRREIYTKFSYKQISNYYDKIGLLGQKVI